MRGTALVGATYVGGKVCVERLLAVRADPALQFSPLAKVVLGMDQETTAAIEAARAAWKRGRLRKAKARTATGNKKK